MRNFCVRGAVSGILLAAILVAADARAQKGTSGPQGIDLSPAVFQELKPDAEQWQREKWLKNKYVLCYSVTSSDASTGWTRVPQLQVTTLGSVACTAPLQDGAPAIPAGERVIIIIGLPAGATVCPTTSPSEVKQTITNIAPTDPYPVRGAPPVSQSANAKGGNGGNENLLAEFSFSPLKSPAAADKSPPAAEKACYLLVPGGLAADTFNTFNITTPKSKGWLEANSITDNITKIHTYYRFGVSTAVVLNNIRSNTYAYAAGGTAATATTPASFKDDTATSVRTVDPVLFLTWYPVAVDIETKVDWRAPLHYTYGLVLGLSEKAPTTNYYLGLSVEPVRNIAVIVGASVISVARLTSGTYDPGPSAMHLAPSTTNEFKVGGFVGLSFNFSNFLTSTLFK